MKNLSTLTWPLAVFIRLGGFNGYSAPPIGAQCSVAPVSTTQRIKIYSRPTEFLQAPFFTGGAVGGAAATAPDENADQLHRSE